MVLARYRDLAGLQQELSRAVSIANNNHSSSISGVSMSSSSALSLRLELQQENEAKRWASTNPTQSLIHDKTLHWAPHVDRRWLRPFNASNPKPPVQLVLTAIGWNQPNQTLALQNEARGARETVLMEGVINHPWFHPTAWEDIESGRLEIDPDVQYYVFFDKNAMSRSSLAHLWWRRKTES